MGLRMKWYIERSGYEIFYGSAHRGRDVINNAVKNAVRKLGAEKEILLRQIRKDYRDGIKSVIDIEEVERSVESQAELRKNILDVVDPRLASPPS